MTRRCAVLFAWFCTVALAGGCSTLPPPRDAIRVSVSNVEVIDATLMEQVYRVTLRIQNRSDRTLVLSGGSFDLELNGRDFGSGVTDQKVEIAPFSDSQIDVRMVSTVFGIVRLVQGLRDRADEPLSYQISGRVSVNGLLPISFSDSGEIDLPKPPAAVQGD